MIFEGTRNTTCKYIGSRRLTVVMLEVKKRLSRYKKLDYHTLWHGTQAGHL